MRDKFSFRRFVAVSALAGIAVALVLTAVHSMVRPTPLLLERLTIGLWPGMIMTMAIGVDDTGFFDLYTLYVFSLSIGSNAVLYSALGALLWWGLYRQRWVLYIGVPLFLISWLRFVRGL